MTRAARVRERLFLSVSIQRAGNRKKRALDRSREAAWASIGVSGTCRNVVVMRLEVSRSHGSGEMLRGGVGGRRAWREGGGGVLAATEQGGGWVGRRRQRRPWRDFQHRSTALRHRPTANAREQKTPGLSTGGVFDSIRWRGNGFRPPHPRRSFPLERGASPSTGRRLRVTSLDAFQRGVRRRVAP